MFKLKFDKIRNYFYIELETGELIELNFLNSENYVINNPTTTFVINGVTVTVINHKTYIEFVILCDNTLVDDIILDLNGIDDLSAINEHIVKLILPTSSYVHVNTINGIVNCAVENQLLFSPDDKELSIIFSKEIFVAEKPSEAINALSDNLVFKAMGTPYTPDPVVGGVAFPHMAAIFSVATISDTYFMQNYTTVTADMYMSHFDSIWVEDPPIAIKTVYAARDDTSGHYITDYKIFCEIVAGGIFGGKCYIVLTSSGTSSYLYHLFPNGYAFDNYDDALFFWNAINGIDVLFTPPYIVGVSSVTGIQSLSFRPFDIPQSGLILRYNLTAANDVTQIWRNQAPGYTNFYCRRGSLPTPDTNDPVVNQIGATFGTDGGDQCSMSAIGASLNGAASITIFVLFRPASPIIMSQVFYASYIATLGNTGLRVDSSSDNNRHMVCYAKSRVADTLQFYTTSAVFDNNSWVLVAFEVDYTDAKIKFWKNGANYEESGTLSWGSTTYVSSFSGNNQDAIGAFIKDTTIFETITYNRALTTEEHANIALYYKGRLQNLNEITW